MWKCKGIVRGSVVELPGDVPLRDGMEVEVRVSREQMARLAFEQILKNPIRTFVGIDEVIEEDKRDRETRWDKGNDQ